AVRPAMATGTLEKGKHYIQVGAYRTESVAADTVSVLRMDYVIVLENPAGSNARIWKIFVGPLGRDESGMALLRVRSLGFKDAFLKIGG
ncbi:MAG: SPOR domain-containing protein, partial [Clostridia bacterium]